MKKATAAIACAVLSATILWTATLTLAQEQWMPLANGASWTYDVHGDKARQAEVKVVGPPAPAHLATIGSWFKQAPEVTGPLWPVLWGGQSLHASATQARFVLLEERGVGYSAEPTLVPVVDARWTGPASWADTTASGCLIVALESLREGPEEISVPAGRYSCLRITSIDGSLKLERGDESVRETLWFARGVGLVKRLYVDRKGSVEWVLTKYTPPSP